MYNFIYLLKFFIYGGLAVYSNYNNSPFYIGWVLLAILMLVAFAIFYLENVIEKNNKQ